MRKNKLKTNNPYWGVWKLSCMTSEGQRISTKKAKLAITGGDFDLQRSNMNLIGVDL